MLISYHFWRYIFIWNLELSFDVAAYIYHVSIQDNKKEIFVLSWCAKAQLYQKIIDKALVVFGVAVWLIYFKCVTPQYTCNIVVNYTPSYIVYWWQHIALSERTIGNMFSKKYIHWQSINCAIIDDVRTKNYRWTRTLLCIFKCPLNPMQHTDTVWRHRSWSSLVQVKIFKAMSVTHTKKCH